MCSAARGQRVLKAGYAYDGEPPVRSGIIADSSARNRQRSQPLSVTMTMLGMDAAPTEVTITGAMPVTRIVPASPITNPPHQFVSRGSPPLVTVDELRSSRPPTGSGRWVEPHLVRRPRSRL